MADSTTNLSRPGQRTAISGFTLIELLVVVAIIGILSALLMPVIGTIKHAANLAVCGSSQRQVYVAQLAYADDNAGVLVRARWSDPDPNSGAYYKWWYLLVDYIVIDMDNDTGPGSADRQLVNRTRNVLHGCPLRKKDYSGSVNDCAYSMNATLGLLGTASGEVVGSSIWSTGGPTPWRDWSLSQIRLRSSRVLLMDGLNHSIYPSVAVGSFSSTNHPTRHRNTANYLMCDGHVTTLTPRLGWFGVKDPRVVAAEQ